MNAQGTSKKSVTLLFNPFFYIAGVQALLLGGFAILLASLIGFWGNTHFDGVLDAHVGAAMPAWVFFAEGLIDWLCPAIVLWVCGRIISQTVFRTIDLLGTQALARWPTVFISLIALPKAFQRYGNEVVEQVKQGNFQLNTDAIIFFAIVFGMILLACWMVELMYKSFSVSCNVKGGKAIGMFIGALLVAEILSKLCLVPITQYAFAKPTKAVQSVTNSHAVSSELPRLADAQIWSVVAGDGEAKYVEAIAWSPDGKMLAVQSKSVAGSKNRKWVLELRNTEAGKQLGILSDTPETKFGVAFSPDSKRIASAVWLKETKPLRDRIRSGDSPAPSTGLLRVWDAGNGKEFQELIGAPQQGLGVPFWTDLLHCAYSPDGRSIAACGKLSGVYPVLGSHLGGECAVWDMATGKLKWTNRLTHTDIVYCAVYSPDGRTLATGGTDKLVRLWDAETGELKRTLAGATWDGIWWLAFSPDGKRLASAGFGREEQGWIRVWDIATGRLSNSLSSSDFSPNRLAFLADSKTLVVLGTLGTDPQTRKWQVRLCDVQKGMAKDKLAEGGGFAQGFAVAPDSSGFVVGNEAGTLQLYRLRK